MRENVGSMPCIIVLQYHTQSIELVKLFQNRVNAYALMSLSDKFAMCGSNLSAEGSCFFYNRMKNELMWSGKCTRILIEECFKEHAKCAESTRGSDFCIIPIRLG